MPFQSYRIWFIFKHCFCDRKRIFKIQSWLLNVLLSTNFETHWTHSANSILKISLEVVQFFQKKLNFRNIIKSKFRFTCLLFVFSLGKMMMFWILGEISLWIGIMQMNISSELYFWSFPTLVYLMNSREHWRYMFWVYAFFEIIRIEFSDLQMAIGNIFRKKIVLVYDFLSGNNIIYFKYRNYLNGCFEKHNKY